MIIEYLDPWGRIHISATPGQQVAKRPSQPKDCREIVSGPILAVRSSAVVGLAL